MYIYINIYIKTSWVRWLYRRCHLGQDAEAAKLHLNSAFCQCLMSYVDNFICNTSLKALDFRIKNRMLSLSSRGRNHKFWVKHFEIWHFWIKEQLHFIDWSNYFIIIHINKIGVWHANEITKFLLIRVLEIQPQLRDTFSFMENFINRYLPSAGGWKLDQTLGLFIGEL